MEIDWEITWITDGVCQGLIQSLNDVIEHKNVTDKHVLSNTFSSMEEVIDILYEYCRGDVDKALTENEELKEKIEGLEEELDNFKTIQKYGR